MSPMDRTDIGTYFVVCPLCLRKNSLTFLLSNLRGGKDYLNCEACGAKWHIGIGKNVWNAFRIQWAELILDGMDRKGAQFLGQRLKPEIWQHMALNGLSEMPPAPPAPPEQTPVIIREKEIIREIVKIRCRHCGNLYLETLDKCPSCGAGRWN